LILTGNNNIDIGNPGSFTDDNIIRIGYGQTSVYITGSLILSNSLRQTGMVRLGSETGAADPGYPDPNGMVVRRVASLFSTASNIVARTDVLTLERDGSNGGLLIRWSASPGFCAVSATGVTTAGAVLGFHYAISDPVSTGTATVFNNAQSVAHYDIAFGNTYVEWHTTHVVLDRYDNDNYIVGTVTSSYNQ
jgi:hypothetical protein